MTLKQRAVVELHHGRATGQPLSFRQIGSLLGISGQAAFRVYQRATSRSSVA